MAGSPISFTKSRTSASRRCRSQQAPWGPMSETNCPSCSSPRLYTLVAALENNTGSLLPSDAPPDRGFRRSVPDAPSPLPPKAKKHAAVLLLRAFCRALCFLPCPLVHISIPTRPEICIVSTLPFPRHRILYRTVPCFAPFTVPYPVRNLRKSEILSFSGALQGCPGVRSPQLSRKPGHSPHHTCN